MTSEDREIAGDADKHMRELLEGALGQDTAFDVSPPFRWEASQGRGRRLTGLDARDLQENDATVVGFRENIVLMPHQVQGVAWMKTRETGRKSCGILADVSQKRVQRSPARLSGAETGGRPLSFIRTWVSVRPSRRWRLFCRGGQRLHTARLATRGELCAYSFVPRFVLELMSAHFQRCLPFVSMGANSQKEKFQLIWCSIHQGRHGAVERRGQEEDRQGSS